MNKVKALFPDNVEKIIISKDDYDRLTGEYLPISKARIEYVCNLKEEQLKEMQMNILYNIYLVIMNYIEEAENLSGNEKYAIGNILDGLITFLRETKYLDYDEEIFAFLAKVYKDERGLDIEYLIKELQKQL